MEQIKSQIEFLKRLYLLKETVNSISDGAGLWTKEVGKSISFHHRLMLSPLAQRVVRDLVYWCWDAARMLENYTVDGDQSAFGLLEDLGSRSLKSGGGDPDGHATNSNALDLNTLELAARTLSQIVDNVFENLLFELRCPETKGDFDDITGYLRLLDEKLEEKLYWLGEILDDLGKIMLSEGISLAGKPARPGEPGERGASKTAPEQGLNTDISKMRGPHF